MTTERWHHIKTIVQAALPLTPTERVTYITNACKDDKALRSEIEQLLQAIEESEQAEFMTQPVVVSNTFAADLSVKWQSASSQDDMIGAQIGVYCITDQVGSGGMGSVFKAERNDGRFSQQVAIKLIRRGFETEQNIHRFRMEQEILARLHHPCIAQLYDGGISDDGLPYLVMEFIEGIPIDEYCNNHQLSIYERLDIFKEVCGAVRYAHSNLVVHRDLKPQNIYVTSEGMVKVLDFGVAKLLSAGHSIFSLVETKVGQKLWTPQYAAPEQVQGKAVTTATDIYALGVLLHKLLTDTYPLQLEGNKNADIEQIIIDAAAIAPSKSLNERTLSKTARRRRLSASELKKELSGDLDALVLKAIRKEPEYRYGSVNQLEDDIERYKKGLPLVARSDTLRYRFGKFVRRHKTAIAVSGLFFLLIFSASVFYTWRITKERNRAKQITQFLTDLFKQSDPMQTNGDSVTVRHVLDVGANRVNVELKDQPDLRAKMQSVIGQVYYQLGVYDKAEPLLESAQKVQENLQGSQSGVDLAQTLQAMAQLKTISGQYAQAEQLYRRALPLYEKYLGKTAFETQGCLLLLRDILYTREKNREAAQTMKRWLKRFKETPPSQTTQYADELLEAGYFAEMEGQFNQAEQMLKHALKIKKELVGENHAQLATILDRLSPILVNTDKYSEALTLQTKAVEINRKENPAKLPLSLVNLANLLSLKGAYRKADSLFKEAINKQQKLSGPDSPYVLSFKMNYGRILLEQHKLHEAGELLKELYHEYTNRYGVRYFATIRCLEYQAHVLRAKGTLDEAAKLYKKVLAQYEAELGKVHYLTASARLGYGHLLIQQDKPKEAERWIQQAIDLSEQNRLAHQNASTEEAKALLGLALLNEGQFKTAENLLRESYLGLNKLRGPKSNITKSVLESLISLYKDWGKPDSVKFYEDKLLKQS